MIGQIAPIENLDVLPEPSPSAETQLRKFNINFGPQHPAAHGVLRLSLIHILIPAENAKDLADVPENVKSGLEIIPVATVDEVLMRALTGPLTPIEWREEDEITVKPAAPEDLEGGLLITH